SAIVFELARNWMFGSSRPARAGTSRAITCGSPPQACIGFEKSSRSLGVRRPRVMLDRMFEEIGDVFRQHVPTIDEIQRRGGISAEIIIAASIALLNRRTRIGRALAVGACLREWNVGADLAGQPIRCAD